MDRITEILQRRNRLVEENRALLDKVEKENRATLDESEKAVYDNRDTDINGLTFQIDELRKLDGMTGAETRAIRPIIETADANVNHEDTDEYRKAFTTLLRQRPGVPSSEAETRAMSSLTASAGGVLIPTILYNRIVSILRDTNVMRQLGTVINVSGPINVPFQSAFGTAYWAADSAAYTESSETFGSLVAFVPQKLTGLVKVPEELIQDSLFDIESFVVSNLAMRLAAEEESKFLTGTGTAQPKGIVLDITQGVTSASPTAVSFDDLIGLEHSVKKIYRRNAKFLLGDDSVKLARMVKDTQGRYLWSPALDVKNPDSILGYPVYQSWASPAYTATTKGGVLFGDFSYYWIAQRCDMIVQRLVELYAGNGQVGYKAFLREDAHLTNPEAMAALTVHAGA